MSACFQTHEQNREYEDTVFWDVTPYALVAKYQCFRENLLPLSLEHDRFFENLVPIHQVTTSHPKRLSFSASSP